MADENPYQAPEASLQRNGDAPGGKYALADSPRSTAFARGWGWLSEGFDYFLRSWRGWVGAMVVGIVIMVVVSMIPVINILFELLTYHIWIAGIVIGCRAQSEWQPFRVSHLFAGFRTRPGTLVLLSITYYAAIFVIAIAVIAVSLEGMASVPGFGSEGGDTLQALDPRLLVAMLVSLALIIPVIMATFFAPHLIVLHEASLFEALRLSFVGCLKNVLPFLLWGLIFLVVFVVVSLLVVLLAALLGTPMLAAPLILVVSLVAPPIMFASIYVAYEEIFLQNNEMPA